MIKPQDDRTERPSNGEDGLTVEDLTTIAHQVRSTAQKRVGDSQQLLKLLRLLEELHREIRDSLFQASLPESRQALYALLKDIEADGGWPYIHRMRLQSLLTNLAAPLSDNETRFERQHAQRPHDEAEYTDINDRH